MRMVLLRGLDVLLFVGKAYRSGTATLESYLTHFDACLPFSSITIATKVALIVGPIALPFKSGKSMCVIAKNMVESTLLNLLY